MGDCLICGLGKGFVNLRNIEKKMWKTKKIIVYGLVGDFEDLRNTNEKEYSIQGYVDSDK